MQYHFFLHEVAGFAAEAFWGWGLLVSGVFGVAAAGGFELIERFSQKKVKWQRRVAIFCVVGFLGGCFRAWMVTDEALANSGSSLSTSQAQLTTALSDIHAMRNSLQTLQSKVDSRLADVQSTNASTIHQLVEYLVANKEDQTTSDMRLYKQAVSLAQELRQLQGDFDVASESIVLPRTSQGGAGATRRDPAETMARYDAALATQGVTDAQRFGPIRAQVLVVQEEFRLRGIQVEQSKYDQATIHLGAC